MQQQAYILFKQRELSYAKQGIGWGLFAGFAWGLDLTLMGMVLGMPPFAAGIGLAAPLVAAALYDGWAGFWLLVKNVADGRWRDYFRILRTRPAKFILIAALLGGPVGMSCNLLGIYFAGASYAAAISAAYPAIGAFLGAVFLKENISKRAWIGIFFAILGSLVVGYVPPEGGQFPHFYLGLGLAAVAALGWALEGVLSTYCMDLVDSDLAIGIRQGTSFLLYLCVVLPLVGDNAFQLLKSSIATPVFWMISCMGMIGGASYLSWYRAMNRMGTGRAMGLNITYAFWSVLFSWLLLGLQMTPTLVGGVVLICIGTILTIGNPKELVSLRNR